MKVFYRANELPENLQNLLKGNPLLQEQYIFYPEFNSYFQRVLSFLALFPALALSYVAMGIIAEILLDFSNYWAKVLSIFQEGIWWAILLFLIFFCICLSGFLLTLGFCCWVLMLWIQDIRLWLTKSKGKRKYGLWLSEDWLLCRKKDAFQPIILIYKKDICAVEQKYERSGLGGYYCFYIIYEDEGGKRFFIPIKSPAFLYEDFDTFKQSLFSMARLSSD